jgi:hypothetical protein
MIRNKDIFSAEGTNIVTRLEACDKNMQRHVATMKWYADLLCNLHASHYLEMEALEEMLRSRKKSFDDELIALEQSKKKTRHRVVQRNCSIMTFIILGKVHF